MAAIKLVKRLQDQRDVDKNGLPHLGLPRYHTDVSKFVVETLPAAGAGSFSLGASDLGNTLGDTGITGTRVVLAGVGGITLSQATDAGGGTISISAAADCRRRASSVPRRRSHRSGVIRIAESRGPVDAAAPVTS